MLAKGGIHIKKERKRKKEPKKEKEKRLVVVINHLTLSKCLSIIFYN